jgi:hypothetical protein
MKTPTILLRRLCFTLTIALTLYAPSAFAQDLDSQRRIERLEATVEELTFKLSRALTENRRMETALQAALSATRKGSVVVSGCDVASFERDMAYVNWAKNPATNWVKTNAKNCTKAQLLKLRSFSENIYYSSAYLAVINYEISQR